jgi:hypothetical protein
MSTHDPKLTYAQKTALELFRQRYPKYFHAADKLLWAYKRERDKGSLRYFTAEDEVAIAETELKRITEGWSQKGLHAKTVQLARVVYNVGFQLAAPSLGWRLTTRAEDEELMADQAIVRALGHLKRAYDALARISYRKNGYTPKTAIEQRWYFVVRPLLLAAMDALRTLHKNRHVRMDAITTSVHLREAVAKIPARAHLTVHDLTIRAKLARQEFLK